MPVRNIRLILEYDGSAFHGWQVQKNGISIQQQLGQAIGTLTGTPCLPVGAGRTDAGVHAAGQVACFQTESGIPPERFATALNAVLPDTISVRSSGEVPMEFHPRKDAQQKHYRYLVLNRPQRSALLAGRVWHVTRPLCLSAMREAAALFLGTHHFGAFCASGHSVKTFVRTIAQSDWTEAGDGLLHYDVKGNGFLYNMVRILAGTMVEVGMGKRTPDSVRDLLLHGDRRLAGKTAPACGLCMMSVSYGGEEQA
jgi:tRNA pseudouridine38-40 synthase